MTDENNNVNDNAEDVAGKYTLSVETGGADTANTNIASCGQAYLNIAGGGTNTDVSDNNAAGDVEEKFNEMDSIKVDSDEAVFVSENSYISKTNINLEGGKNVVRKK